MSLEIHQEPDPILHQPAQPAVASAEMRDLAKEMFQVMREHKGVGLAAPQIGRSIRLLVAAYEQTEEKTNKRPKKDLLPSTILLNPVIVEINKKQELELEGCLSLPDIELPIWRSIAITVQAEDEFGQPLTKQYKGYPARILQHEIDHLNGTLITDRVESLRVIFMGTPAFAVPSLRALVAHPAFDVISVITEVDKPSGRGQQLTKPAVKIAAEELDLPIWQPESWKNESNLEKLRELKPDLIVVAAYGRILPAALLSIPSYGTFNVHASLLPRWRGASPIQAAIQAGDNETGITIMQLDPGLDTGPILTQTKIPIEPTDTTASLTTRLAQIGGELLVRALIYFVTGIIEPTAQPDQRVTITSRLTKEDGRIDWKMQPEKLEQFVRAMNPWPGAWTEIDGKRLVILGGHVEDDHFIPDELQPAGKQPMSRADFERGWRGNQLPWQLEH